MDILTLTDSHPLWHRVRDYAAACSWRAGASLSRDMAEGAFATWERVFVAVDGDIICGYCTARAADCIPQAPYTPYIGYVFVAEPWRGRRVSQQMIERAADYLRGIGFDRVHIVSDHDGLYEKYGFAVIDRLPAPWGAMQKIYMRRL